MNLETATYSELELALVQKERECQSLYVETRDAKTPDVWMKLKECEEELDRIARALDKALRR